ncbi:MAG TPA: potassium channel protein, partial [Pyrinomonadaceae bacterium]|nr:potassium channel protein [Pyrinomonadaceae bacterium]
MKRFPIISMIVRSRLSYALAAILVAVAVGSVGFYFIEGFSPLDSIYLATETVTTVGYGDLTPKTSYGRVFAIFFMLFGGGTVLYALTVLVQTFFQAEFMEMLDSRRKIREMEKLRNHYIVCGAGRVGKRIIRSLEKQKIPFVVIEREEGKSALALESGGYVINGDATLEETLKRAGVHYAKGLASCLADDAANVYVVLTARGLNGQMHIVARAVEEEAEPKLIRAGANRVVAPTIIGSQSMARALLKPTVADFMDSIVAETMDLVFEEVAIRTNSMYAGKCLKETNIRAELNLVIVAIRRQSGEMIFQPSGDDRIA